MTTKSPALYGDREDIRLRKGTNNMDAVLRSKADEIIKASLQAVLPDEAVQRALRDYHCEGRTILVAGLL